MALSELVLVLAFIVGGITLKLADLYAHRSRGFVFAAISALCLGFLISANSVSSAIVLGIILAVTVAGKIDQLNLLIGLGFTVVIAIILGFSFPDLPLLAVVTLSALIDEVGHEKITARRYSGFFRFRMTLKIIMIMLAISMQINLIYTLGFLCFDFSYDALTLIGEAYHWQ